MATTPPKDKGVKSLLLTLPAVRQSPWGRMARALRLAYAGAFYHVTCRGNARQPIFRDERDRFAQIDWLATPRRTSGDTLGLRYVTHALYGCTV